MGDQAQGLRDLFLSKQKSESGKKDADSPRHHRVISFTSGKGGVGKTNLVTSFAQVAANARHRVLVMDADLGLGNIDVLLGMRPKKTLQDVLEGRAGIRDVLLEGPGGVTFLPGGSGIAELTTLETAQKLVLVDAINELATEFDTLLVDTGAGISPNVLYFNQAATEVVTVVTPEPTSIADAYGMIKVLHQRGRKEPVYVLVNMARNGFEAVHVFQRLAMAAERFLGMEIINLGWLPRDPRLESAVRRQVGFVNMYPHSKLANRLREVSTRLFSLRSVSAGEEGLARFWSDLVDQEASDLLDAGYSEA